MRVCLHKKVIDKIARNRDVRTRHTHTSLPVEIATVTAALNLSKEESVSYSINHWHLWTGRFPST